MCEYRIDNKCTITSSICPYVYWCDKLLIWKETSKASDSCKLRTRVEIPKGYYKVEFARKKNIYVFVENQLIKFENPYEEIPTMVKLSKTKNGWKIRKD